MTNISYDAYRQPWAFGSLLSVTIPSLICSILILAFIIARRRIMIRKALHHHAVLLLTIVSLLYTAFDLPFSLNYFRIGYHPYRSIPFCLWWYWFDYSLAGIGLCVIVTASIQRHILIFNSQWLHIRRNRILLHYLPLAISTIYPPFIYIVLMFLYQCEVYFNPADGWCAYPCYLDDTLLFTLDWIGNNISLVFILVLANVSLVVRVFHSMRRIRRRQHEAWARQRRLTLQLFAYSSLYMIVYVPMTTVALLHAFVLPNLYDDLPNIYYIFHLAYFLCPLQVFLFVFALPEFKIFLQHNAQRAIRRSLGITTVAPIQTIT